MPRNSRCAIALVFITLFASVLSARADEYPFAFRDLATESGLTEPLAGMHGHGAGWGDVDGDGLLDLVVGTFHKPGGKPNQLFRNRAGSFLLDAQPSLQVSNRATGVVLADFDNDGDLDLYIGSMPQDKKGESLAGCSLFQNEGDGQFKNISSGNGACPAAFGGRSAAAVDFDGDGRLDLLVGEDPLRGYNGSPTASARLFRNLGQLRFEDVSRAAGLVEGTPGLGVAAADVNNDGWPDLFLAATGSNVLLLNDGRGKFREAPNAREVFAWPAAKGDNMVCGISFGDVNRDGLLDVVLGQHFERPWREPVANRLYLNRGITDGVPTFEDITQQAGLIALPMKSPHVELQDFDNDGWPDLSTSLVKFRDGRPYPVIFKHYGVEKGLPKFREDALSVNDFPTSEDQNVKSTGAFFDKLVAERKIIYTAPGPSADYDNDGRLDMFLASWFPEAPSLLLHNETPIRNWLQIELTGTDNVNRQGIGSRIHVYSAGKLGQADALIAAREMAVGFGYASGQPAIAHFGLGDAKSVDVEVILPHGRGTIERREVAANQRVTLTANTDSHAKVEKVKREKKPTAKQGNKKKVAKKTVAKPVAAAKQEPDFPPALPGNAPSITDTSRDFLRRPETIHDDVAVAKQPPTVEFLFYPGQDYPGEPWSNWGDSCFADGKYYSAIGDHLAISKKGVGEHGVGSARVFEYDPESKQLKQLADTSDVLKIPAGHYAPGKIHTRVDLGSDGWLYYATHRGSPSATTAAYHYQGDWIFRTQAATGKSEIVATAPVPFHSIPCGLLDPDRLIYYGGTAAAIDHEEDGIRFLAYDVKNRKLLYSGPDGPARYMMLARSTGRLYFVPGADDGPLMRFDPAKDKAPKKVAGIEMNIRAASDETADGKIYTVSKAAKGTEPQLYEFDTKTEKVRPLGSAAVGTQNYVASLDADPTGRYLYYVPGAHGGSPQDGSAVVQFDIKTGQKKVLAFLEPYYSDKYGFTLKGTYATALDDSGERLYITWNVSRGTRAWDSCGMTVIEIPASERLP